MPFYVYECDECGHHFEKLQRMSEDPLDTCPECGGRVHRVVQPVGIVFKGSGFYVTDNRKGASMGAAGTKTGDKSDKDKESSSAASSNGKDSPGDASKPEAKEKAKEKTAASTKK